MVIKCEADVGGGAEPKVTSRGAGGKICGGSGRMGGQKHQKNKGSRVSTYVNSFRGLLSRSLSRPCQQMVDKSSATSNNCGDKQKQGVES